MLTCCSSVQLFATLWTVAHQAPLSVEFPRQEYWSGLLCPPPGDLPNPGTGLSSPALQVDSLPAEAPVKLNSKGKVKVKSISLVQLFATPWTVAHQTPPSMEFFRQEYWSGLPFLVYTATQ